MPNLDVLKLALIALLVVALVGLAAWFVVEVVPDIIASGVRAESALVGSPAAAWGAVTGMFGVAWADAWSVALAIVLLSTTVFFIFKVIRWVL